MWRTAPERALQAKVLRMRPLGEVVDNAGDSLDEGLIPHRQLHLIRAIGTDVSG